jgi:hypothetical protein
MTIQEPALPILALFRGTLSVWSQQTLRAAGIRFLSSGTMRCKASAKRNFKEKPGWLLDLNGQFTEFYPTGYTRLWLQPLSPIVQFVRSEFRLSPPRTITTGELATRISTVRDQFREAPIAKDLRKYLTQHSPDTVIDRAILEKWPI